MAQSYSVKAILSAVDNGFTSTFNNAASTAMSTGEKIQSSLKGIGNAMSVAGAATAAMGVAGLKHFGEFQQQLNTAAVVAGGTAKDIDGLANVANKMGADLPISAQEASNAMTEMARNGASVGQIKEQFPAIAQAATAAGSDLSATAGVVQQAMNIWGKSLESPQQAAEILVQTANLSNASIEDMQQAMANIGGTANMAGISLKDTSEAIGLLTNHGFSAAQASQDLNHAILQMVAPSKVAQGTMQSLGISFTDAQGKMKPLPQILQELNTALDGLKPNERTKALKAMFGTAGMGAIEPLMEAAKNKTDDAANSWDAWSKTVDKAAGTGKRAEASLKDQANEMQKNVGAKIEQVGGNWEALRNTSMASHNAMSSAMLDMINNTLTWANSSHSAFAKFIQGAIGLAPVLGPAITMTGQFVSHAEKLGKAAIAAGKGIWNLVARFTPLQKITPKASAGIEKTSNSTKKAGQAAGESAANFLRLGLAVLEIGAGVGLATAGMAMLVLATVQLSKQGWAGAGALLAVTAALGAVVGIMVLAGSALTAGAVGFVAFGAAILMVGVGIGAATAGIAMLLNAFNNLNTSTSTMVKTMTALGQGLGMMFTTFITTLATQIPVISQAIMQMLLGMLNAFNTALPQFINVGVQIIVNLLNGIAQGLPQIINAAVNLIGSFLIGLAQAIPQIAQEAVEAVLQFVQGVGYALGYVLGSGTKLIQRFVQGIRQGFKAARSAGKGAGESANSGAKGPIAKAIDIGVNFAKGLANGISKGIKWVIDAARSLAEKAVATAKAHLKVHSPSRVMRDEVGVFIPAGMAVGMLSNIKAVTDAAGQLANAAMVTLPAIDSNKFDASLSAINQQMNNSGINVNGTLSANNTITAGSRNFEGAITELVQQAVRKLDNVDQHPIITMETADKINERGNATNADIYRGWGMR